MLNTQYIFQLLFKILLATYFISHGLQLLKKPSESSQLAARNFPSIDAQAV